MKIRELAENDINFSERSIVDPAGKVFFYQDRVFRAIYNQEYVDFYTDLLEKEWLTSLFDKGLVRTWICEDIKIPNIPLIIEHEKIQFVTVPSEWTSQMFWKAAKIMINLNLELSYHGFLLKDSHLWNILYHKGNPVFIDFGSITKSLKVSNTWFDEFVTYIGVPLWLNTIRCYNLAAEYRREHSSGFGITLFRNKVIRALSLRTLMKLIKLTSNPTLFFENLSIWIDKHRPRPPLIEKWDNYYNKLHLWDRHESGKEKLLTKKQQFVYDILRKTRPLTVLDCAANKGFYSEMAANMGGAVLAFDHEEHCIDDMLRKIQTKQTNITPIIMDFQRPTPNFGRGLSGNDALKRFNVDIILVLGLIHHICLKEKFPVKLFCDICCKYANKGVVLEFIEQNDKHVIPWNLKHIPADYSIENVLLFFRKKFASYYMSTNEEGGLCRKYIYFY
ncbi:MAG: hypothetical protein ACTFAL_04605 [Candidatus Electronema sp. V4]|uniref:hypothetical protein n=1 Tax=Candidatus Electronema sp. V4 TaxID=3454756 RepID=UPI0040559814